MCKKNNVLLVLVFVFSVLSLLSTLLPVSDIDGDGYLDSLVTNGLVLLPKFEPVIGLFSLLTSLPVTCLIKPQTFSIPIVPPPIPTE
jgi:hypothetical protein